MVTVNTVAFDVLTKDAFSAAITQFKSCGNSHVVHFLAAHPTVVAREVPAYGDLLRRPPGASCHVDRRVLAGLLGRSLSWAEPLLRGRRQRRGCDSDR
jgi:hypothetical protein